MLITVFMSWMKDKMCHDPCCGHAHIYLDGRKIDSVYEPLALPPKLAAGKYRLAVSSNLLPEHKAILVDRVPVSSEIDLKNKESNSKKPHSEEQIATL